MVALVITRVGSGWITNVCMTLLQPSWCELLWERTTGARRSSFMTRNSIVDLNVYYEHRKALYLRSAKDSEVFWS